MTNIKESAGIICIRKNKKTNEYEVLLIEKKYTFCFCDFILGNYKNDSESIRRLLNNMTIREKQFLLEYEFEFCWKYIFGKNTHKKNEAKKKYENMIKEINIKELISNSFSSSSLWEAPKGRIEEKENTFIAAKREFKEETGIDPDKLTILIDDCYEYKIINKDMEYITHLYTAIMPSSMKCDFVFDNLNNEISDIKWISLSNIENYCNLYRSYINLRIKFINKHYKFLLY